jgi:hypothetical protein
MYITEAAVQCIVYVAGYPILLAAIIWRNRELMMEDQLLRAKVKLHW